MWKNRPQWFPIFFCFLLVVGVFWSKRVPHNTVKMQAIKLKMQTLTKERDDALARVAALEERVEKSQGKSADTDTLLSEIATKQDACESRLETSQENMVTMQQSLNEVGSQIDDCQIRISRSLKLSGQDDAKSNSMSARYNTAMKAADDASSTIETLNKRIDTLEDQLVATDDRVSKADDAVASMDGELRSIVDQIRSCNASASGQGNRTNKLNSLIDTKEKAKRSCAGRLTTAESKATALEARLVEAEQEVVEWQEKTENAKKEFEESVSMLAEI